MITRRHPMKRGGRIVRRTRLRPESTKRHRERGSYNAEVREFLRLPENRFCPVRLSGLLGPERAIRTSVNHHKKGRIGSLYRDRRFWLAVSVRGHRFIHDNPNIAFERGWMLKRGLA